MRWIFETFLRRIIRGNTYITLTVIFSKIPNWKNISFINKIKGDYYSDGSNFKYKGKYYINQKLEYEGIYEYGNKWDGKGYDEYGNIIYELNNGNGKVKEYEDGELYLEGEYLSGKRNGKCKQYFDGKLVLDGEYLNGKKMVIGRNMMKVVWKNLKVHI